MTRQTYTVVVAEPTGGWIAHAGYRGYQPHRKWCFTRWGARLAAYRMARRLQRKDAP